MLPPLVLQRRRWALSGGSLAISLVWRPYLPLSDGSSTAPLAAPGCSIFPLINGPLSSAESIPSDVTANTVGKEGSASRAPNAFWTLGAHLVR